MASFTLDGVKELIKEMEKLNVDIDDISFKMVDEVAGIIDKELKTAIKDNTKKYGTGTLAESIHHNKPKKNMRGYFTVSTARGTDNRGRAKIESKTEKISAKGEKYTLHRQKNRKESIRNQDKLYYLEFGNSRQASHPIIGKCIRRTEPRILDKMQAVFNRETRKL